MIKLFDSLSQRKKPLPRPKKGPLKLFVCGPTVYDYSHIGHARTYVPFDSLVKYLRSQKISVAYLQNITDIDDKIINRAKETKIHPLTLSEKFAKEYFSDIKKLNISEVNKYAKASRHIKEIHRQINALIKKGYAYQTDNGVYFEVKKFKNYGKLSHQNPDELLHGHRVEADPQKKNPMDFALWKKAEKTVKEDTNNKGKNNKMRVINGEPLWASPWGWGRPGWHIEDTAITEKYFGPQYDIHGGASELKFPHHEAEIAQQECASGKSPLVKIWLHTGLLLIGGEKMSKSLKNFITIKDFIKKYSPEILRLMILSNHYRSPFDYKEELAIQAQKSLDTIKEIICKLNFIIEKQNAKTSANDKNLTKIVAKFNNEFNKSLDDDFNTPKALAALFDFINKTQPLIFSLSKKQAKELSRLISEKIKIFGISIGPAQVPAKIQKMTLLREKARRTKDFAKADLARQKITSCGYLVEDTPLGAFIKKG